MNVGSICSRRVINAPASASLSDVVKLMLQERVGMVIVSAHGSGSGVRDGVITRRDIV